MHCKELTILWLCQPLIDRFVLWISVLFPLVCFCAEPCVGPKSAWGRVCASLQIQLDGLRGFPLCVFNEGGLRRKPCSGDIVNLNSEASWCCFGS